MFHFYNTDNATRSAVAWASFAAVMLSWVGLVPPAECLAAEDRAESARQPAAKAREAVRHGNRDTGDPGAGSSQGRS